MSGNPNTASCQTTEEQSAEYTKLVLDKLGDEATRCLLIQKLKESGHVEKNIEFEESCDGGNPLLNSTPPGGDVWLTFPVQYPFAPFPALPFGDQFSHHPGLQVQTTLALHWFRMDVGPARGGWR